MNTEQIEEGNKLIAEFMNLKIHRNGICDDPTKGVPSPSFGIKYHSSWDWLMPVVKKIQQLEISDFPKKKPIMSAIMDVEIESLWNSIVVFIKWYNKQVK